jgi:hypothetical protein
LRKSEASFFYSRSPSAFIRSWRDS